jgi:uncharacterized zinc-type alcohol dehydrogenase-like protein
MQPNKLTNLLLRILFQGRDPRDRDVVIEIQYCGICHSDIYQVVPGHEIVGIISGIGSKVT